MTSPTTLRRKKTLTPAREPLTLDLMRQSLAAELKMPPESLEADEDLIRLGIDSIGMMRLANSWRRHGVEVKFAALLQKPTLAAWWELASVALAQKPAEDEIELDEHAPFELTPMQQAYWIGSREGQVLGGLTAQYYIELDGKGLEPLRLEQAIRSLQARHPLLRAQFLADGRQQIMKDGFWSKLVVHDLRQSDPTTVAAVLDRLRADLARRNFAVDRGEVFDIQLTLLPLGATRLHINIAMVVCDARSFQIVLEDLAQLYNDSEKPDGPSGYTFQKYLRDKAKRQKESYERARAYWQDRLVEMPGGPLLPLAVDPACLPERKVGRRFHWISPQRKELLREQARSRGLSLPIVFATAFAETIGTWSAEQQFLLNVPLFDREEFNAAVGSLVGDFTNVMIVPVDVSGDLPFSDQARLVQARFAESAAYSEYSGVEVLRDLARSRPGEGIVAPVVFTSVIGMGDLFSDRVRQCFGSPEWITSQTPQVWLDHQVIERDGGLLLNLDFVQDLFPADFIDSFFPSYLDLLERLTDESNAWSESVPSLVPQAEANVRRLVNDTGETAGDLLLHAAFFEQAANEPDRTALDWRDRGLCSYGALAGEALSIAAALIARGVEPGDPVAITMPRGPDQIAGVLGVLAAGAIFVPVGVDQPEARRSLIYKSVGAKVILIGAEETPPSAGLDQPVFLSVADAKQATAISRPVSIDPDSLAYVIYTSGSTGPPKGVEITHRAAMNTIAEINSRFGVTAGDKILAVSALDFDLSVYDIFGLLSVGGVVVLIEDKHWREAHEWLNLVVNKGVTIWNSVPALLDMLLVAAESKKPALGLRLALLSGDWVGLDLPERLAALAPACRFIALGGATEAAIWSIAYEVDEVDEKWRSIPYGFPLRGQKFRIVDGRKRDRPNLVPGELWIGGAGLAAGYRNDCGLTAERFVAHNGERWYRTGDMGRYRHDGSIEFLGRLDQQVKIHGHRIELAEIEAALEAHPQVNRAVAFTGGKNQQLIAAAITCQGDVDESALRTFAADRLPHYMIPRVILVVDQLPLTANGKLDLTRLGSLLIERKDTEDDEPPRSGIETSLAQLWSGLLGRREIGRHSNFLALGGDSLSATRLLEMLRVQFGVELSLRQLMAHATISDLSQMITRQSSAFEEGVI